ncbi:unnamed protein product [Thelazia callipaeda]|uniref:Uncharacterized protein n=1 Tax=Thelazia callipaeda TaxID=103827 RepID=A0A0N5D8W1_THECL|nr:unnamed protein product [Thelazia callipaeda]
MAVGADILNRALSACFAVDKVQHVIDTMYGDEEPIGNHLLMKSIAAIGRSKSTSKHLSTFVEQLRKHVDHCKQIYKEGDNQPDLLQSSIPLHLNELVNTPKIDLLLLLLKSSVSVVEYSENIRSSNIIAQVNVEKLLHCLPNLAEVQDSVFAAVSSKFSMGPFCFHSILRHCSMVLQVLSFAQLIVTLLDMVLDSTLSCSFNQGNRRSNLSKNQRKNMVLNRLYQVRKRINEGIELVNAQLTDASKVYKDDLIPPISYEYSEVSCS